MKGTIHLSKVSAIATHTGKAIYNNACCMSIIAINIIAMFSKKGDIFVAFLALNWQDFFHFWNETSSSIDHKADDF